MGDVPADRGSLVTGSGRTHEGDPCDVIGAAGRFYRRSLQPITRGHLEHGWHDGHVVGVGGAFLF